MRLAGIDYLRGIAVLAVLVYHFFVLMHLQRSSLFGYVHFFGLFGVSLFFVISGFLIYRSVVRSIEMSGVTQGLKRYALHRFFRIVPAYYFNFAIVLMLASFTIDPSYLFSKAFLGQIAAHLGFFAYFVYRDTGLGVNGAYWTLDIEMLWYLIAPLLAWVLKRPSYFAGAIAMSFAYLLWIDSGAFVSPISDRMLYAAYLSFQLPGQLLFFVAGIFLYRYRIGEGRLEKIGNARWLVACLSIVLFVSLSPLSWMQHSFAIRNAVLVVTVTLLFVSLYDVRVGLLDPLAWIGKISYSLYLWHMPVLFVLDRTHVTHYFDTAAVVALFVAMLFPIAAASYYFVETGGERLRKRIEATSSRKDSFG